ncbi:hypothetical protein GCM10010327_45500 [Streptomyces nitrosporeus]|nr:hypothetical protein GCM10010327_45500 [Streptomyces nitrosporeus]
MLQLVELGGGEPVVPLAAVGLGLADPAAQGFLVDVQVLRDVGDGAAGGADLARSRSSSGYLRGAAMVLVDLLRQDGNPGIRDSINLSTAQG